MKNMKSFLFNLTTVLLGIFTLIFLSQAYIQGAYGTGYVNAYEMIDFSSNEGRVVMTALSMLMIIIFVSLLVLLALVNILKDFNAFKASKNFGKIMSMIEVILTGIILGFSIVGMCCLISLINDMGGLASVGWALILNTILAAAMFVVSIFKILTVKKK